jgi:hypothetical protein
VARPLGDALSVISRPTTEADVIRSAEAIIAAWRSCRNYGNTGSTA